MGSLSGLGLDLDDVGCFLKSCSFKSEDRGFVGLDLDSPGGLDLDSSGGLDSPESLDLEFPGGFDLDSSDDFF